MTTIFEGFEQFSDLSKQGLEPVKHFTGAYVDAFEKIARTNYAFAGDVVNFAVSQARLPLEVNEPKELFARQVEATKAFAELVTERANEYVALGNEFKDTTTTLINDDIVEPAKKAAEAATQAAAA